MTPPTQFPPIDLARESDFVLGATRVSPATREMMVRGRMEKIEPRVLQVLVALAQRRGNVVSRDELSARCWKGRTVGDDALNRCIASLRRLADASGDFKVETIPRIGYRMMSDAARGTVVEAESPGVLPADPPTARGGKFKARVLLATLSAVLAIAILVGFLTLRGPRSAEKWLEGNTYIVLPFEALNDDSDTRNFAQVIAASTAHVLSRAGRRVIPPTRAAKFLDFDRAHLTEETGARFIVDGEVRRQGNLINVLVRVDDGRTGRTLMTNSFESNSAGMGELADTVAGYVGVRSWSYTPDALESNHAEVVDAGFRTSELLVNGESRAAYDLSAAVARKYPDDAQALMMLSVNSTFNYWTFAPDEVAPAMQAARAAAQRVTEIAPHFGDVYIALSTLIPPQRWAEREVLLRRGLEIDPDTRGVGNYLAGLLAQVGRLRDAEMVERGVIGLDPFNREKILRHFDLLQMLGNRTDARALMQLADRYLPADADFTLHRFMASDFRGAAPEAAKWLADPSTAAVIEPLERQPVIRQVLRALESRRQVDADAAVGGCGRGWVSTQTTTACLLGMGSLGRLDDAFAYAAAHYSDQRAATVALEDEQWLKRERGFFDTTVLYRAELAPMRADPRFIALAERVRLLDYWRAGHSPDFCETEHVPVCQAIQNLGNP